VIGEQRAAHMAVVVKLGGFVAVAIEANTKLGENYPVVTPELL